MKKLIILSVILILEYSSTLTVPSIIGRKQIFRTIDNKPKLTTSELRIVNGSPASLGQIPFQCSVLMPIPNGFAVCGGSIISNSWILTAAHCTFLHSQFNVRFGTLNLLSGGQQQISFSVVNHPLFSPATMNNDVSLIQIPSPLVFSSIIQPVQLATITQKQSTFIGIASRISGWGELGNGTGASDLLQFAWMNPISNAECQNIFGTDVVESHVICARGWDQPIQGHCGGDAGGPMVINELGAWTQIGIISFGAAIGCSHEFPHGYMRTSYFVEWIEQISGIAARE